MNEFEKFSADVHNAFELLGGKKSYDSFIALISASAKQDEQERIIKLLETTYNEIIDELGVALVKRELDLLLELIALIKGENK